MLILTVLLACPAVAFFAAGFAGHAWGWAVAAVLALLWLGGLAFFRDPQRQPPDEPGILVAPADGRVVETAQLDLHPDVGGPATRIGIFMSVFDVHVNRSPCSGIVKRISYQPGQFLDARDPKAGQMNEASTIVIEPDDASSGPVVVRLIAGLIARRIVCGVKVGDRLTAGQRIGLVKFGSRAELIVPTAVGYAPAVVIGDKARAGVTILARRPKDAVSAREPITC